jgi:hypothetical protein
LEPVDVTKMSPSLAASAIGITRKPSYLRRLDNTRCQASFNNNNWRDPQLARSTNGETQNWQDPQLARPTTEADHDTRDWRRPRAPQMADHDTQLAQTTTPTTDAVTEGGHLHSLQCGKRMGLCHNHLAARPFGPHRLQHPFAPARQMPRMSINLKKSLFVQVNEYQRKDRSTTSSLTTLLMNTRTARLTANCVLQTTTSCIFPTTSTSEPKVVTVTHNALATPTCSLSANFTSAQ